MFILTAAWLILNGVDLPPVKIKRPKHRFMKKMVSFEITKTNQPNQDKIPKPGFKGLGVWENIVIYLLFLSGASTIEKNSGGLSGS